MSDNEDERRTVLITGCSPGGIGHSLARSFHERGYRVFATARSTAALADLSLLGVEAIPLSVDSEESIQACKETVMHLVPKGLDFLINNAGINYTIPALDADLKEARKLFDTNFFAVVRMVQVFAPLLIQARGSIVMIGSLAGVMPYAFGSLYNASKAALHAYSNTLRVELAPFGVKVITIVTGGVASLLTTKTQRTLPTNSLYRPVEAEYNRRLTHSAEGSPTPDEYVKSIIDQILPGGGSWPWRWVMQDARNRWVWAGRGSGIIKLVSGGWFWNGLLDWVFTRQMKLSKLNRNKSKTA